MYLNFIHFASAKWWRCARVLRFLRTCFRVLCVCDFDGSIDVTCTNIQFCMCLCLCVASQNHTIVKNTKQANFIEVCTRFSSLKTFYQNWLKNNQHESLVRHLFIFGYLWKTKDEREIDGKKRVKNHHILIYHYIYQLCACLLGKRRKIEYRIPENRIESIHFRVDSMSICMSSIERVVMLTYLFRWYCVINAHFTHYQLWLDFCWRFYTNYTTNYINEFLRCWCW